MLTLNEKLKNESGEVDADNLIRRVLARIRSRLGKLSSNRRGQASDHRIADSYLELLVEYQNVLSIPSSHRPSQSKNYAPEKYSRRQFYKRVSKLLEHLCSLEDPFRYHSACLWLIEKHQDRGEVIMTGPEFGFNEVGAIKDIVEPTQVFPNWPDLTFFGRIDPSVTELEEGKRLRFNTPGAPLAIIPLYRDLAPIGVLTINGRADTVLMDNQEQMFLRSLASIVSNGMEQWDGRYRVALQREMDNLFKCTTLEQVFSRSAIILKNCLRAAGCMVVFRPDPNDSEMTIVAKEGFTDDLFRIKYSVGRGQTGRSAEKAIPIRWDDVSKHNHGFDSVHLACLAKALREPVVSWMSIPIGSSDRNYGVIKVVNSRFPCGWFTDSDQSLAEDLALRLHVIIEKLLHIVKIENARAESHRQATEAHRHAQGAVIAQRTAEEAARQRQQDLMTITHELQGPLVSIIGTLTGLQRATMPKYVQERLEDMLAYVEDALSLCYGVFTSFGIEAGQIPSFGADSVDVPLELRQLSRRLQKTNARDDLSFVYKQESEFPRLVMDRNVFAIVLYNLIHNAMKYADQDSEVTLECGFEYHTGEAVVKVKSLGEQILPREREAIFSKFQRGQAVNKGRHHSGIGLGLWVARGLMYAVGGDLTVELSPNHPRLSIFVVHIPTMTR